VTRASRTAQPPAVLYVFRSLIEYFEDHRQGAREVWGDSCLVWLALLNLLFRSARSK
jgi:hypothetical protein